MDLAHACQPRIELRERAFQHLAMARILRRLELLQDPTAGQVNRFFLLLVGYLLRCKSLFRFALGAGRGLLLLYRLAFPPSRHDPIIASVNPRRLCSALNRNPFPETS